MLADTRTLVQLGVAVILGTAVGIVGGKPEQGHRTEFIQTASLLVLGSALLVIVAARGFVDLCSTMGMVLHYSVFVVLVGGMVEVFGAVVGLVHEEITEGVRQAPII